jgi:hypothetical protein
MAFVSIHVNIGYALKWVLSVTANLILQTQQTATSNWETQNTTTYVVAKLDGTSLSETPVIRTNYNVFLLDPF